MNLPVADQPRPPEKPTASNRFQFATGDRPLSGYTIKRGVGRGGFGEVYFAVSDGGKEVALKLIRRNLEVELRGVQHCLNLKHPNLIAIYDIRQDGDGDDCWIVMEYVAGDSLEGTIRRHPQGMPAEEAIDWLRGIAAGASYLHSQGIVHRDLKPANVFRDGSQVKLGDYGLSKFISCSRRSGQTESVGTVHYMAPEVAHGRYGREIDIYALGIMLYEMLTGRVPFDGESVGEVLMKHLTAQPDVSLVPAAYRAVVARALAKDPAVRFSSIDQFLAALPTAGQVAAAAAPARVATARLESDRAGKRPAPPEPSLPGRAMSDPVPPARVLWALGCVLVSLALIPAGLGAIVGSGQPSTLFMLLYVVAFAGLAGDFLAKSRARWKASQAAEMQPWPATSDVPPPLPPMPMRRSRTNSVAAGGGVITAKLAEPGLIERLVGLPPAVLGVIGAVLAGLALPFYVALRGGRGGPSSLVLIGLTLIGGYAAYSWANRRAPRRSANRHRPTPASQWPPAAVAVSRSAELSTPALVVKSPRERWIDLLESLLRSSAIAIVLAVIAAACQHGDSGIEEVAWFALTATLGAWGVLFLSKLWEGSRGEPILRRFAMLAVGLGLGAASFGFDRLLMVRLPFQDSIRPARWHIDWSFYSQLDGAPHLEAYLAYFGLMFFLVPWWRQADPLRPARVRLGSLVWTVGVALLVQLVCPFPQPWGAIVATIISLALQLSTAPVPKSNRLSKAR